MAQTPQDALIDRAKAMTSELEKIWDSRLEVILKLCATTPSLFPARQGKKAIQALTDIDDVYLEAFICRYYAEREGILVLKPVATKPDPAVDEVLKAFGAVRTKDLEAVAKNHRLSMQAENIVGKLLERYVATLLEKKGWIWCCGE